MLYRLKYDYNLRTYPEVSVNKQQAVFLDFVHDFPQDTYTNYNSVTVKLLKTDTQLNSLKKFISHLT